MGSKFIVFPIKERKKKNPQIHDKSLKQHPKLCPISSHYNHIYSVLHISMNSNPTLPNTQTIWVSSWTSSLLSSNLTHTNPASMAFEVNPEPLQLHHPYKSPSHCKLEFLQTPTTRLFCGLAFPSSKIT